MTRRSAIMLTAVSPLLACAVAEAQKRASPHETVSVDLGGNKMTITYGRPYLKGRHVGEQVAPYNEVWRLGADEATKITVTARTKIANSLELAPGSYSLFAIPQPDKWTIIVDKVADQWGAFKYDQSQDLGRFDVKVTPPASPAEQFTISLAKQGSNTAALTFAWDKASVSTTLKTV
ncbi:MAG: DUF2911 domain-containing protein [Bryobacteraceae bacterium]